jgi:phospholipid N-methyltransferase
MKITVKQLRRIIKEEVQKVVKEVGPGQAVDIDAELKTAFDRNEITADLERRYVSKLKKMYHDDGFSWQQHLIGVLGDTDEVEEFADELVNAYLEDF